MIHRGLRAKYFVCCLALIFLGAVVVCWQGARAERSQAEPKLNSNTAFSDGSVSDAAQVISATSGKIAFSSDRIAGILKIFTMNPDGTGVTCLMCNGATDPSGTGSTDPRVGRGPAFSPDGNTIAFVRTDLGEIWLMNSDGTNPRTLTTGSSPSWSPDGARIAFTRSITTTTPAHNEIFVINADGSGLGNITNGPESDVLPSWGAASPAFPQGRIAFRSLRNSNSEIYVIAPTSMSETFLSAPKVNVTNNAAFDSSPEWSPDGRKLAFYSDRDQGTGGEDIYTMEMNPSPPVTTGLVTRLTTSPNNDSFPTWSPDGKTIAYTSFPGGNLLSEVLLIDAVTGAAISPGNITNSPSVDFDLTWGTPRTNAKVVFQKGPNSTSDIYLITPGSGTSIGIRKGYHPAFSPDGTKIAFVDNTPGAPTNGTIMLMDANGMNQRSLAHPAQGFSPTWAPDGLRLAFVRGDFDSVGNDGKGALYVIDMTPGNEGDHETLIPGTLQVSRPSWGSNNRIVYACLQPHPGGGNDVLGIRVTEPIPASAQIAANPPSTTAISGPNLNDRDPSWSADGTAIAFLSTRDYPSFTASEIYVMDAQGNNVRPVTNSSNLFKSGPAWSPDGTKIVFYGGGNLRLVNSDCSKCSSPTFVTSFTSGDSYPSWGTLALATSSPTPTPTPTPTPVVNLEITKSGPTAPVNEDDEFVYNISVKNSNNSTGVATGVKVVDPLPNGVQFKRSSNTTCVDSQDIVTCNLPDISVSDTRSVSLIVSGSAGIRNNQASVTANQHLQPVLSNIVKTTVKYDNDNFAKARQISGDSGDSFSSNVGATKEVLSMPCVDVKGFALSPCEPNHARRPGHQSVWWKWRPSHSSVVYFDTASSQPDTTIAAYALYGGKLTERASNDDFRGPTSFIGFKAFAGDEYYIVVDGYQDSAGDIFLHWSQNPEIKPSPQQAKINILDPGFAKLKEVTTGTYNLRIIGTGFNELSQIYVNGLVSDSRRPNRSVTPTEINVLLPASDISRIGPLQIVVCGGADSQGACANNASNAKIFNVIGYSAFEVAPGQIIEVCKLDDAGRSLGMCFTTSATTCPGPGNCQITASLYEAITVADLKARSVGTKFHNIGMGVNNDIQVKIEIDEAPPAGSVAVASTNLVGGLLSLPIAPGLLNTSGVGLLDYSSTRFTAEQFARSLELIGNDGGTLLASNGSKLVGQDGGTIWNKATGFNYNNAYSFITRLIGNDGGTFTPTELATLVGQDGGTLIGNDGGTLIGNDGGTLRAASAYLGSQANLAAVGAGLQAGNLINPNQLLANLHGVNFVNHNGGDLVSNRGSGLIARKGPSTDQSLAVNLGDGASAPDFDPNYKGWFVVSGSGGTVPAIAQTTDTEGNAGGVVNIAFDNTSSPKIADLASTVLTVAADPSIVQFSTSGFTVSEGGTAANITVTRTGDNTLPLTVRYSTGDGSALQRSDYKATSGTLSFAVGEASRTFTIPIVDDLYSESSESINIGLRNADVGVLGTRHTAALTITDNDGGISTTNPVDTAQFFVRQHYYDVFDRLPDQPGLDSRVSQISQCGSDAACVRLQRTTLSLAFLNDSEFQETGFFIARVYKALIGRQPTFSEFLTDRAKVLAGPDLSRTKTDFINEFLYRQVLVDPALAELTSEQFVDRLNSNSGGAFTAPRRDALVQGLKVQSASMASVLAEIADNATFKQNERNRTFLTMLYFTLLRRDTDALFASRLQTLNQNGDYAGLIDVFVNSSEYRTRFGISAPVWEAVVLTAGQTEIKTWTSGGRTYAYLKLSFPNAGYRVANWGQASQSGNNFTGDALVEKFSGASVQAVTTTAGMYDLGVLAPGNYSFTFKNSGTTVKTHAFTVAAPPSPANPIDDAREFVRQQYRDFLNREADQAGEDFWTDNITKCNDPARRPAGQTVEQCTMRQRETTSGAFFLSPEFQYTGYFVYRMYQGALGRQPKLSEFIPDAQFVGNGIVVNGQLSAAKINQNRADYAALFVDCTDATKYRCAEFKAIYDGLSNQQYVDKLFETTGVNASAADRTALVNGLNANPATETRASVLQKIVDGTVILGEGNQQFNTTYGQAFFDQQFTRAFVQLEYFGYMKRDPDEAGYAFWLDKLNLFGGDFVRAEMVLAFISSPEYRARFGQP